MRKAFLVFYIILQIQVLMAQDSLPFSILLKQITISALPGLHSYAHAQHDNKWLIVGGRLDGLHARQPFNSFPAASNNTNLYVIDPITKQFWSQSINHLPAPLKEQLQSTNMNFEQHGDTLYIVGGYAFSQSANNHVTFSNLITIQVSSLIKSIIQNDTAIAKYFKQVTHPQFAVTGGHLAVLNDTFLLIGGHQFNGRYNPMGNPTFTQTYTNQIRRFIINNSADSILVTYLSPITNEVHLHRRDYNLVPRINPDGSLGYTISSGVFQIGANLPFLYPVDIYSNAIRPITSFNQYLSNYHSAVANIYFKSKGEQYNLFFGGMSQYYYQNDSLIKDDNVPFTKTISALKRTNDTTLLEIKLPVELDGLKGASAEFILNKNNSMVHDKFTDIEKSTGDTIILGYIYGGITSPSLNPFTNNQTTTTSADSKIYEVKLIRHKSGGNDTTTGVESLVGMPSLKSTVYPNPADDYVNVTLELPETGSLQVMWLNTEGKLIKQDKIAVNKNSTQLTFELPTGTKTGNIMLVLALNNKYYANHIIQKLNR